MKAKQVTSRGAEALFPLWYMIGAAFYGVAFWLILSMIGGGISGVLVVLIVFLIARYSARRLTGRPNWRIVLKAAVLLAGCLSIWCVFFLDVFGRSQLGLSINGVTLIQDSAPTLEGLAYLAQRLGGMSVLVFMADLAFGYASRLVSRIE